MPRPSSSLSSTATVRSGRSASTIRSNSERQTTGPKIGQAHRHMFSRFLNLRIFVHRIFFVLFFIQERSFLLRYQKCHYLYIITVYHNRKKDVACLLVYDRNQVSVSGTGTKVQFRYWFRSRNFLFRNRNFFKIFLCFPASR